MVTKRKNSKKSELIRNVKNYLKNFEFENKFYPIENLPFGLHWSDSRSLMESIKIRTKFGDEHSNHQRELAMKTIEELKSVPLWIKLQEIVISMTLFDVYHTMGKFIQKEVMENELYNCNEISFIGPTGPFKEMPLIDCINERTLQIYIHLQVMINKLPQRSFRLSTQGVVLSEYFCQNNKLISHLNVKQITDTGILFSTQDESLLQKIDSIEEMKIYFESQNIHQLLKKEITGTSIKDIYYTDEKLKYFKIEQSKIIKKLKYDSHLTGEYFLFCRYIHMKESEIPSILKTFTQEMKDYLLEGVA